jgi:hypothetical protein
MNLNEMNYGKKEVAKKALKEHFEMNLNVDAMNLRSTKAMLTKVRGLINETRTSKAAHQRYQSQSYLKLVMMEQALSTHYKDLRVQQQIMMENEEVQKSQVILAAQDMVDSIQKMIEDISKMKVEELNAVVTGINNEFGTQEGESFNNAVTESLGSLEQALSQAKQSVTSAMGALTGQGGFEGGDMGGDMGADDAGMGDMGGDLGGGDIGGDMGGELPEMPEEPVEEPEELGNAGRAMR